MNCGVSIIFIILGCSGGLGLGLGLGLAYVVVNRGVILF